jgi:guanylate kinase
MTGLILTGLSGVGKTTAELQLCSDHGFWVIPTVTTRVVDAENDHHLQTVAELEFLHQVRSGDLSLPFHFANSWYAWRHSDLQALISHQGRAVLNLRPQPALTLHAFLPKLLPVWIEVDEAERERRITNRQATRDTNPRLADLRHKKDLEDASYRPCFKHARTADAKLVSGLIELLWEYSDAERIAEE